MFKRNRITIVALGLALLVSAALLMAAVLDVFQYRQFQVNQRANTAAYYSDPADIDLGAIDPEMADATINIGQSNAAQEHDRYAYNLQAQQDVALFTRILAWAAVIGIIVSSVGIWLIFATLRASRELTRETKGIGYRQLRPYLCIESVHCKVFGRETDEIEYPVPNIEVTIIFKNAGQTPALNLRKNLVLSLFPYPFKERRGLANAGLREGAVGYTGSLKYPDIAPGETSKMVYRVIVGDEPWQGNPTFKKIYLDIKVLYRDFADQPAHEIDVTVESIGFDQVDGVWIPIFDPPQKRWVNSHES
ncbi:hypothetical protein L2D01_04305 [Hyphomonadaceae bacterium ML37]|nr:hypothetical protein L2D01_04305 [Hyphomonadaceae bacterium ML37]